MTKSTHKHGNFEKILNSMLFFSKSTAKGDLYENILSDISFCSISLTETTNESSYTEKSGASLLNYVKLTPIFWYAVTFPIVEASMKNSIFDSLVVSEFVIVSLLFESNSKYFQIGSELGNSSPY